MYIDQSHVNNFKFRQWQDCYRARQDVALVLRMFIITIKLTFLV